MKRMVGTIVVAQIVTFAFAAAAGNSISDQGLWTVITTVLTVGYIVIMSVIYILYRRRLFTEIAST